MDFHKRRARVSAPVVAVSHAPGVPHGTSYHPRLASDLDREADALLFLGRHAAAERLSNLAWEMRRGAA